MLHSSLASNSHAVSLPAVNVDLAVAFAQKYVQQTQADVDPVSNTNHFSGKSYRAMLSDQLLSSLRSVSATSWSKTEGLMAKEIVVHGIDPDLIDPWQISGGIYQVYKHAVNAYAQQQTPHSLVRKVSPILGETRKQATAVDPRVIGFVAMQYHYTGKHLMEMLPENEQENFASYVKVLDDHLYMPLQRAYQAAANHPIDSLALKSVQLLMSMVSDISERIVERVVRAYPRYRCYSQQLSHPTVRISSVRDVEMFQVYMWVCLLEGNLQALQEELFPLCVMLYPRLNVSWELVRQMIYLLRQEINACLPAEQSKYCEPYYEILTRMFSLEVFPNTARP